MEERIERLEKMVDKITGNDLPHIGSNVSAIKESIAVVKTDLAWLKKFFWIVAGSSVTTLASTLLK